MPAEGKKLNNDFEKFELSAKIINAGRNEAAFLSNVTFVFILDIKLFCSMSVFLLCV